MAGAAPETWTGGRERRPTPGWWLATLHGVGVLPTARSCVFPPCSETRGLAEVTGVADREGHASAWAAPRPNRRGATSKRGRSARGRAARTRPAEPGLLLGQLVDRDARPVGQHLGDDFLVDERGDGAGAPAPLGSSLRCAPAFHPRVGHDRQPRRPCPGLGGHAARSGERSKN